MGSSSSKQLTIDELTMKTMMLAQRKKTRVTNLSRTCHVAASFLPNSSPAELLKWIQDPVLDSSRLPLDDLDVVESFELEVLEADANIQTTLVLPSGVRIAVRLHGEGVEVGETVYVNIRVSALEALGQDIVRTYRGEDMLASQPRRPHDSAGELRPLDPEELESECPLLLAEDIPESLRGGDSVCVVCAQPLDCAGGEKMLPLRQLPCSHAFHSECVDQWLCEVDRSCPTCRALVAPDADDAATPRNLDAVPERAWLSYVAMRESGALAALNRVQEEERADAIYRADQADREWRASSSAGAIAYNFG